MQHASNMLTVTLSVNQIYQLGENLADSLKNCLKLSSHPGCVKAVMVKAQERPQAL